MTPPRRGNIKKAAPSAPPVRKEPSTTQTAASVNLQDYHSSQEPSTEMQPADNANKMAFKHPKTAELFHILLARPNALSRIFSQGDLLAIHLVPSAQELLLICQELVDSGLFQALHIENNVFYRLKSYTEAMKVQLLDNEARIIYNTIEAAGSTGIWTKTLKAKTNLHQTVLTKALRSLESKSYIKQIKNARFPGRKIYMLQTLNPNEEVTGGPFFTDGELDEGLIEYVTYFILIYVRNRSWRIGPKFRKPIKSSILHRNLSQMLASDNINSKTLLPHPAGYSGYPTTSDILDFLNQSGIFENKHFTQPDLQTLLDVMVFDRKLEIIRPAGHPLRSKSQYQSFTRKRSFDSIESDADSHMPSASVKRRKAVRHHRSASSEPSGSEENFGAVQALSDSENDPEPCIESMYRSVYRPGPPPPMPESVVIPPSDEVPEFQVNKVSDQVARSKGKGRQKQKNQIDVSSKERHDVDEDNDGVGVAEPQQSDGGVLAPRSKERAEAEEIEELLAPSNPFSETPCARCPVFNLCGEGSKINAKTCEYFPVWLQNQDAQGRTGHEIADKHKRLDLREDGLNTTLTVVQID